MKWTKNNLFVKIILSILLLVFVKNVMCQNLTTDNDTVNTKRLKTIIYTGTGLYAATQIVLYFGWYKDTPLTNFHFINDNKNDLLLDKLGHATTSYTMTTYSYNCLRWSGLNNEKSAIYGSVMGFTAMSVFEILDGFSDEYGASWGDLIANATGPAIFLAQQLAWKEQRFRLKFSYHPTDYAQYNPDLLGHGQLQRALKDYNGMTFWLSGNIHSFLKEESRFPKWINVGVGYGGSGIIGAASNPTEIDGYPVPYFKRTRQYYVSMDIDWTKIETNSMFLRVVFKAFSFVKLPFPTLEYNKENQFVFHFLYF